MHRLLLTIAALALLAATTATAQLPADADGWTVIAPSPDSRLIYVSSSGGDDDNDGLSAEAPVATIAKAASLARAGMPDHIYLKTGDTFATRFGVGNFHSGRSPSEPTVIGTYGGGDARPIVELEDHFLSAFRAERAYIAIVGIDFYAPDQDPNSPQFDPDIFHGSRNAFSLIGSSGGHLLIEDCRFRYIGLGAFTALEPGDLTEIRIRRNIVVDAWADSTYFEHYADGRNRQQGMYIEDTRGVLIEENLFDHNGWNDQVPGAGKNKFNHNVYMQVNNPDWDSIRVRGNILARASAHGIQMRSGGIATDNLLVQNSVNVNIGYGPRAPDDRTASARVADNVFHEVVRMDSTEANRNNPQRSGALWGVSPINLPSVVTGNVFAKALNTEGNVVTVAPYEDIHNLGGELEANDNIVYRWFSLAEAPDTAWFDPDRDLGDYARRLGLAPTTEAFLERARERPLHAWWEEYSAYAANDFLRAGFATDGSDPTPPPAPDSAFATRVQGATATVTWTWAFDDVRTRGYDVYLDGAKVNDEPVAADSLALTGLTFATTYTAEVRTVDAGRNESAGGATVTFTTRDADTAAPTVPAGLEVTFKSSTTIELRWGASVDDRCVRGYRVYLDGDLATAEPLPDTALTLRDLTEATTYRVSVSAVDFAGNESARSPVLVVKTVDGRRPTSPDTIIATLSEERTVTARWGASTDNDTLAGYRVFVNWTTGAEPLLTTADTAATFEAPGEPPYFIRVQAVDVSGNTSRLTLPVEATRVVNTGPAPAAAPDVAIVYRAGRRAAHVETHEGTLARVTLASVSGQIIAEEDYGPAAATATLDLGGLPAGSYVVSARLRDGRRASSIIVVAD